MSYTQRTRKIRKFCNLQDYIDPICNIDRHWQRSDQNFDQSAFWFLPLYLQNCLILPVCTFPFICHISRRILKHSWNRCKILISLFCFLFSYVVRRVGIFWESPNKSLVFCDSWTKLPLNTLKKRQEPLELSAYSWLNGSWQKCQRWVSMYVIEEWCDIHNVLF